MLRKLQPLAVAAIFLISACNNHPAATTTTNSTSANDSAAAPQAVQTDIKATNNAYFIAGMDEKVKENATLTTLAGTAGYRTYAKSMNDNFGKIEKERLAPMRTWASNELNKKLEGKTLFYPFSGPDILHATTFYPDADTYILMALELPGGFPNFEKKDSTATTEYLGAVNDALSDVFNKSYFITSKMNRKVNFSADGTIPLMCLFLARSGYEVLNIEKRQVQADGSDVLLSADSSMPFNSNRFVEIYFRKTGTDKVKRLLYFSGNICDDYYPATNKAGLKENKALVAWLDKNIADCNTYLKAASYLMHGGNYSIIRGLVLKHSKTVLQDDTGIAYRYFDKNQWNINLYGGYIKPVKDFSSGTYQKDLKEAYSKDSSNVKKLSYSLGYHWQDQSGQNLMKAERK